MRRVRSGRAWERHADGGHLRVLSRSSLYPCGVFTKYRSARTVLAGAALMALGVIALAGCGGSGNGAHPDVSMAAGASSGHASGAASRPAGSGANSATSSTTSNSFVASGSIPFPVAVGDTWVYQTTAAINGANSTTTNKIVSAGPASSGYQVTMSQTTDVGGSVTTVQPVYMFYPNGTIGYPVTQANGVLVTGSGVLWPDAAGLASGQPYHSVLRVRVSQGGSSRYENANVTVQGAGTAPVTVLAGSYQATVVDMTIATRLGDFGTAVEVRTWLAPETGPVRSEVFIHAAGKTELITTNQLVSFTKGAVRADGS
jgi:hypothetical protein